jgi:hypothetical protein
MMNDMRPLIFLLFSLALGAADLSQVRTVYILPMAGGLDQHLANRITEARVFQVVTDPKRADAVITDRLGPSFEERFDELYPPPAPPKPAEEKPATDTAAPLALGDTVNKLARPQSSFSRGKGTIFLVSVQSREVLWSTFEKPKNTTSGEMDRTAGKVVADMKKGDSKTNK